MALTRETRIVGNTIQIENPLTPKDVYDVAASFSMLFKCGIKYIDARVFGYWMTMDYIPTDFSNNGEGCKVLSIRQDGILITGPDGRERKIFSDEQLPCKTVFRYDPDGTQPWEKW